MATGRKKPRTAAQKAATARMLEAAAARRGGSAPKRRKGAKRSKGAKGARGLARAQASGMTRTSVAFLPLTKANVLENQKRTVHAIAMLSGVMGHNIAATQRMETALVSKGILSSRYNWPAGMGAGGGGGRRRRG